MEIKKPIPTFPPPRRLINSLKSKRQRSLPKLDYSTPFRLILRLEKTYNEIRVVLPLQFENFTLLR